MAPPIPSPESSRDVTPALIAAVDSAETRLQALKAAQSTENHAAGGVHAGQTAEVLKKADEAKAALALAATTAGIPPESSAVFTSDIPATPAAPKSTPSTGTTEASTSGKAATPETHTPAAAAAPAQAPATAAPNPNEGAGGGGQSSPERAPARPNEGAGGAPQASPTGGAEGAPPASPAAPAETPAPAEQKPKKGFLATFTEFFEKFSEKIGKLFEGLVEKLFGKKKEPEASASAAPATAPAAATGPEVLAGPDTTVGLTGQALVNNPQFLARTEQIAAKIGGGTTRDDLLTIMNFETARSMDPKKKNPKSSASGLIQFIDTTAAGLGTSTAALRDMSALQQLDYVEKYFQPYFGKLRGGFSDLYRVIFFPASIGKPANYIFGSQDGKTQLYVSQNHGFATDVIGKSPDGTDIRAITNSSFERQCATMRKKFAIAPQPTTPKPNS